jgi:hypothetical protein
MNKTVPVNLFVSSYDVYVDGPDDGRDPREIPVGQPGFLGNPFSDGSAEDNLYQYKRYFLERISTDDRFKKAVMSIYGLRLGCVSDPDQYSHGRFVAEWLNAHRRECQAFSQPTRQQLREMGIES